MIDFSRSQLTHFTTHFVGNKGIGENLILSEKQIEFKDDFVKELVLKHFLMPFKSDVYYKFRTNLDLNLNGPANFIDDYFTKKGISFINLSKKLASHLFDQTMHPKLMGGHFCVCYLKDVIVDGELVDAIGLFKTEKEQSFLKFNNTENSEFNIDADSGINISKLDKGCLIYNTERSTGYKLSIIDNNRRTKECMSYWEFDFLNATIKPNSYYHTSNFIESIKSFCEEKLPEIMADEFERASILTKSVNYVNEQEKVSVQDYVHEVLGPHELEKEFKEHQKDFNERLDLVPAEDFEVSNTAIKENKKYMRTVLKLDNNFHVYIHSQHDKIEYGYDEEKGMKYMKLFFVNKD